MPKNYDTEPEEYATTLYTDYDDAEDDAADEFEEPLVADFSDDADEDEEAEVNPQENVLLDLDTTDEDDDDDDFS